MNVLLAMHTFGAFGAFIPRISDMIVSGNVIGVDALAGIAAVIPVTIGAQFLAKFVYCGAGYLYAKYQGEFKRDRAKESVGLALEVAACVGVLIFLAMTFGRDWYMDFMGLEGAVREQAVSYWRWVAISAAINPVTMVMWQLVYADGETVTTAIADLTSPLLTILLSAVFAKHTGTAGGSAFGTMIAINLTDAVMMLHLLRKSNSVVPKWCFSFGRVRELFSYSLTDSSSRLCQCGLMAIINKLVVGLSSTEYLPLVGMASLVIELREILDRIGDAYMPIAEMYLGERNYPQVRTLARYGLVLSVIVGFAVLALIEVLAPQIVDCYGIPAGGIRDHAVIALRLCALSIPIACVIAFIISHYLVIGKVALSVIETVFEDFLLAASCATLFSLSIGVDAIWFGLPIGSGLALLGVLLYARLQKGVSFPMLIPPDVGKVLNITFRPLPDRILAARDESEDFLREAGVPDAVVKRVMLLVEECAMELREDNARSRVLAEDSFLVVAGATHVVIRDTGRIRDITDSDARVKGLRGFVVANMMESYSDRRYLSTIGCNRAAFTFSHGEPPTPSPRPPTTNLQPMTIVYPLGTGLYVNLTNRCPCACTFCIRQNGDGVYGSDSLWLEREPTTEEVNAAIDAAGLDGFGEVVFCGYGEPTERLDVLLEVARHIRRIAPKLPIRVNTNGLSDLIAGRPTAAEFKGLVDTLSISMNAPTAEEYVAVCRPKFGLAAYEAMLKFAAEAVKIVPTVVMSVVGTADMTPEKIDACKAIAAQIGAQLRVRTFAPPRPDAVRLTFDGGV